ncbi:MAG: methionyl-tRNA formyltransferase, partial [Lachnospiraceae bacterium]|nr:methionyl-tRNA formyltransferase [Lachnospiraceae bacterium]
MRIIFMGTPDFSAGILKSVYEAGHEVVLVVTQPDKPKGRSGKPVFSPVKECALSHGTEVFQPVRIKQTDGVKKLSGYNADIFVVAAFGQILPESVLNLPRLGCINVHTSLLPKYRGASPIEAAILSGEKVSGVTTMQMDAGLDTGDILLQREIPIDPADTGGSLTEKMARLGGELIVETLAKLEEGTLSRRPQEGESCYAGLIKKEEGELDFALPASALERRVRAFDPWPGTYTFR